MPDVALAADGLPEPRVVPAPRRRCGSRAASCSRSPGSPRSCSTSSSSTAWSPPRTGTGHYDADALVVATTARELAEFGLEPRHLRAFRTAADREVGLVEQVVAPHARAAATPAATARAEDAVRELAALSVRLHATLVKAGLRAALTPAARRRRRSADPRSRVSGVREVDVIGVRVEMPSNQPIVLLREVTAASATCRSGSAPSRPPRSRSPSRASCRRGR